MESICIHADSTGHFDLYFWGGVDRSMCKLGLQTHSVAQEKACQGPICSW